MKEVYEILKTTLSNEFSVEFVDNWRDPENEEDMRVRITHNPSAHILEFGHQWLENKYSSKKQAARIMDKVLEVISKEVA